MAHQLSIYATTRVPPGLRGAMNKWCVEVLPGIFVGTLSGRVRSQVWQLLTDALAEEQSPAYAAFISPANNEQGFTIETYGDRRRYRAEDFDGLTLQPPGCVGVRSSTQLVSRHQQHLGGPHPRRPWPAWAKYPVT